jgi:hypothetical protein
MRRIRAAVVIASLPLFFSLAHWAAWHFFYVPAFYPLSLSILGFPACLGYAAVLFVEPRIEKDSPQRNSWVLVFWAMTSFAVAYACALYAWGSMQGLFSEHYKFRSSSVSLSKSTMAIWGCVSIVVITVAVIIRRMVRPESLSRNLATATIGMSSVTAVLFSVFLVVGFASYRQ